MQIPIELLLPEVLQLDTLLLDRDGIRGKGDGPGAVNFDVEENKEKVNWSEKRAAAFSKVMQAQTPVQLKLAREELAAAGKPTFEELPKQYEQAKERIEKIIEEKEGEDIDTTVSGFDSLSEDDQQAALESFEEGAMSEAVDEAWEELKDTKKDEYTEAIENDDYAAAQSASGASSEDSTKLAGDIFTESSLEGAVTANSGSLDVDYGDLEFADDQAKDEATQAWMDKNGVEAESEFFESAPGQQELFDPGHEPKSNLEVVYEEHEDEILEDYWKTNFEDHANNNWESTKEDYVTEQMEALENDEDEKQGIYDNISEVISEKWASLSDEEKLGYANSDAIASNVRVPDEYLPFDAGGDSENYTATQSIARTVQLERTKEILKERGLDNVSAEHFDQKVFSNWKGSSTGSYGKALQLAASDELGSVGKTEYEEKRAEIIDAIGGDREYEGLKAYTRATWESSQYVLDKAEVESAKVSRGLMVDGQELGAFPREKFTYTRPDGEYAKGFTQEYTAIPGLGYKRNGAQSTTTDWNTSNSWGGVGNNPPNATRVVLTIDAPREAFLSLPVHGQNLHNEQEVVLTGVGWKSWTAWEGKAPTPEIEAKLVKAAA